MRACFLIVFNYGFPFIFVMLTKCFFIWFKVNTGSLVSFAAKSLWISNQFYRSSKKSCLGNMRLPIYFECKLFPLFLNITLSPHSELFPSHYTFSLNNGCIPQPCMQRELFKNSSLSSEIVSQRRLIVFISFYF